MKRLIKEVSLVLLLKASLLIGIWYVSFTHPISESLSLTKVEQHWLD